MKKEDPTLSSMDRLEQLNKVVSANNTDEFEFLGLVITEMLRFKSPAGGSGAWELT